MASFFHSTKNLPFLWALFQILLLSKKLATVELKELNERQRAAHADKMYHILKGMCFYFSSVDGNTVTKCVQ